MTERSLGSRVLAFSLALMMFCGLVTIFVPNEHLLVSAGSIPSTISGNWTIADKERYDGGTCVLSGNLTISSGGNLVLNNLTIAFDNELSGRQHVQVQAGGILRIFNSTLKSNTVLRSGYFDTKGVLQVENSTLRDFGPNGSYSGIYMDGGQATFKNDTLSYNDNGMIINSGLPVIQDTLIDYSTTSGIFINSGQQVFRNVSITHTATNAGMYGGYVTWGSGSATFYDSRITNNQGNGIYIEDMTSDFYNTPITGNKVDLSFTDYGAPTEARLYNSKYDTTAFSAHAAGAIKILVYWWANISASWQSDNSSVSDGTYTVLDQGGATVKSGSLDGSGQALNLPIKDYSQTSTAKTSYGPYTFNVIGHRGSIIRNGTLNTNVRKNTDVNFSFDDLAPSLSISSPIDGLVTNKASVQLVGLTEPLAQVWVQDNPIIVDSAGAFTTTVILTAEGKNLITVKAKDLLGNERDAQVNVTRDTLAPVLTIENPKDKALFNTTLVFVRGTTEPGALLKVNGANVTVDLKGKFYTNLTLPEGTDLITVTSTDQVGNSRTLKENVTIDLTPPVLDLSEPKDGFKTQGSTINVSGTTEETAVVTVNGVEVSVVGTTFHSTVDLLEGKNTITIESCDQVHNCIIKTYNGTRDSTPPVLSVSSPTSPAVVLTNKSQLSIIGTTEPGATVTVNGKAVDVAANGGFSYVLNLQEGDNQITVNSTDLFGNTASVTRDINRDSTPPNLELKSPADGLRTKDSQVKVTGTTEAGALVSINGEPVTLSGSSFSKTVALDVEGANRITVIAMDAAGNSKTVSLTVVKDSKVALVIAQPLNNIHTEKDTITVIGVTDPKAKVIVENIPLTADGNGRFSTNCTLAVGENIIHVTVTDDLGNTASGSVTVTRDKTVSPHGSSLGTNGLLLPLVLIVVIVAGIGGGLGALMMKKKKVQQAPPPVQPTAAPPPQPPVQYPGGYDPNAQYYNQYGNQQYPPQQPPNNPGY